MSTTPRLYLAQRRRNGHAVVTAIGAITRSTVLQLRSTLLQALARGERSLLLDLAGVDRIDDAGLAALDRTATRADLLGGRLRLVAPAPPVAAQLHRTGLDRRLAVSSTLTHVLEPPARAPGVEDPDADWVEQHQPADPADADTLDDVAAGEAATGGEVPLDADPADHLDQHTPVPVGEEDYPATT